MDVGPNTKICWFFAHFKPKFEEYQGRGGGGGGGGGDIILGH